MDILFVIVYFFYKYSVHYFAFLEASSSGSRSTMFLITQFKGDFLALFSMILRFYSLLLRLNVYDILDDCLDFYYVFLGDFDDDDDKFARRRRHSRDRWHRSVHVQGGRCHGHLRRHCPPPGVWLRRVAGGRRSRVNGGGSKPSARAWCTCPCRSIKRDA